MSPSTPSPRPRPAWVRRIPTASATAGPGTASAASTSAARRSADPNPSDRPTRRIAAADAILPTVGLEPGHRADHRRVVGDRAVGACRRQSSEAAVDRQPDALRPVQRSRPGRPHHRSGRAGLRLVARSAIGHAYSRSARDGESAGGEAARIKGVVCGVRVEEVEDLRPRWQRGEVLPVVAACVGDLDQRQIRALRKDDREILRERVLEREFLGLGTATESDR